MNNESKRRKVSITHDDRPSIHHIFNYQISRGYIKGKDILDIGCWTGVFLELAQNKAKTISGIDPGSEAIAIARKKIPTGKFLIGEAQKLKYKDRSFDSVFLLEVLEHVPPKTERTVIAEIYRVLKSKGVLVLSTPNNNIFSILGDPAFFLINHRHYSMDYLRNLLTDSGFRIKKTYQTGGFIRIITVNIDLVAKHLLGKTIKWPRFIDSIIEREYRSGGFFENHLIAEKTI